MGSSILDYLILSKVHNNSERLESQSRLYNLDNRSEYLNDRYGLNLPNFYGFNVENPAPEKPRGAVKRAIDGALLFGAICLVVGAVFGPLFLMAEGAGIGVAMLAGAGALGTYGLAIGALVGLVDDDKPGIEAKQMGRYEQFLQQAENQARSVKRGADLGLQNGTSKRQSYTQMVDASRAELQEPAR